MRVSLVLSIFGASRSLDAFFVAFRIPNLFRDMLAEGALSNAFTKVYSDCFEQSEQKAKNFFSDALKWVLLAGFCIALAGVIAAPFLVKLMTMYGNPGDEFVSTATLLTRILFPFLYLMMLGSVFAGTLHHKGRFFLSSVAPLGFNFGYILGAVTLAPILTAVLDQQNNGLVEKLFGLDAGIVGLALGVLLGGLIQTVVYGYKIWKSHIRSSLVFKMPKLTQEIKSAVWIGIPVALASVAGPINQLVNTNFATGLEEGAITWLDSAFRLFQLPIGLFGVSVGVVMLPQLTKSIHSEGSKVGKGSQKIASESIVLLLQLLTPCFLMLFVLGEDICRVLYGWGRFEDTDVVQTAVALKAYAIGLFGYGLIKVLMSIYYAIGRTRFTLVAASVCVLLNAVANYHLVETFGHQGLAVTSSIVLSIQAGLLGLGLYSTGILSSLRYESSLVWLLLKAAGCFCFFVLASSFGDHSFSTSLIRALICGIFCVVLFWGHYVMAALKRQL